MKLLLLSCAGFLLVGIADLPIGYYTFLRILVTIGALAVLFNDYEGKITGSIILFCLIVVVFNPLMPVYLYDKGIWIVIDLVTAVIFLAKTFY